MQTGRVAGLVLAAGAGRRMGVPKALLRDQHGTAWVVRAAATLRAAGCDPVTVVVGAAADAVRRELAAERVEVVHAPDWRAGMGASLRAGLTAMSALREPVGVVVVPVDLPDLTPAAVSRVLAGADCTALARATYAGVPGHPVLIGRAHWPGVITAARGDVGARDYLRAHQVTAVECADLCSGADVDLPERLPPGHTLGRTLDHTLGRTLDPTSGRRADA
ncbi:MAG TPA: NTP transferase domain-containing protein [Nocardioidaceae bacterium]|nr:NTP transferase domain-containing protein [Nocardioidaceae bacterium]